MSFGCRTVSRVEDFLSDAKKDEVFQDSLMERDVCPTRPGETSGGGKSSLEDGCGMSVAASNRSGSAPLLVTVSPVNSPPSTPAKSFRRPSCVDGVIPTSIIPKLRVTGSAGTGQQTGTGSGGAGGPSPPSPIANIPAVIYEESDTPSSPPSVPTQTVLGNNFD